MKKEGNAVANTALFRTAVTRPSLHIQFDKVVIFCQALFSSYRIATAACRCCATAMELARVKLTVEPATQRSVPWEK